MAEQPAQPTPPAPNRTLLDYPEIAGATADAIRQIPPLLERRMIGQHGAERFSTAGILVALVLLSLVVILPVSLLTWIGKMSPDAATFVFGAIVGAAFTFLRDAFPRGQ